MVRDHFWQRVSLFQQYYTKMIRNFQSREATALVSSLIGMCGINIFIFVRFLKKKLGSEWDRFYIDGLQHKGHYIHKTCFPENCKDTNVVCPIMWTYDICAFDTSMYYDYYWQNRDILQWCKQNKHFRSVELLAILHRVQKKGATDFFAVTFTNIDGFS